MSKTKIDPKEYALGVFPSARAALAHFETLPEAPDGLRYFAVGPYCWGKAVSATAALRNARKEGGSGVYVLHLVNKDAEVSSIDGCLSYNSKAEGIKVRLAAIKVQGY